LEQDHNDYKALLNQYFRAIRIVKQPVWKEFLANAHGTDIFTALRFTKPRKAERTPPVTFNNTTSATFEEKGALFRTTMFPPPPAPLQTTTTAPPQALQWILFTPTEIRKAIFSPTPRKAP
jgi:hypothetical protein